MSPDCPKCDKPLTRIARKPWMRHIPGSKFYKCRGCHHAYLMIFNRWLLKWTWLLEKISSSKQS